MDALKLHHLIIKNQRCPKFQCKPERRGCTALLWQFHHIPKHRTLQSKPEQTGLLCVALGSYRNPEANNCRSHQPVIRIRQNRNVALRCSGNLLALKVASAIIRARAKLIELPGFAKLPKTSAVLAQGQCISS